MAIHVSNSKFKKVILKIKAANYPKMKIKEEAMRYLRPEVVAYMRSAADVEDVVDLALAAIQAANVRAVTRKALGGWLAIPEPRPATSDEVTTSTPPTSGATVPEQVVEVIDLTADNDDEAAPVVRADEGDASDSSETEWKRAKTSAAVRCTKLAAFCAHTRETVSRFTSWLGSRQRSPRRTSRAVSSQRSITSVVLW
jgi:hypothetical protein